MKQSVYSARSIRGLLMAGVAVGAVALSTAPAMAQEIEEIVVTGSRIVRQDFTAISPVATVGAEQIQSTGTLAIEQVLNTLPQVVPGFSAASNNPSDGTATVDLRGLGASRTLVLVNGHRFNPSTKGSAAVDLNNIPARLIERVEVVTGGASAVYGSDALAGVVNFVMKKDFEGAEISGQWNTSEKGDGQQTDLSFIIGSNFDNNRGNITAFASLYDRNQVLASARDWAAVSNAGGSGTGRAQLANAALNKYEPLPTNPGCPAAATNRSLTFNADGSVRGFCNDFGLGPNSDRYNFSPVNNLLSPAKRLTTAFLTNYEVTDWMGFNAEFYYSDSRRDAQLAPTPMTSVLVPVTNPFLSASARAALASRTDSAGNITNPNAPAVLNRRMEEMGPRVNESGSKLYQANLGTDFKLPGGWTADAFFSYGRTEFTDKILNDVSRSRVAASMNATSTTSCGAAVLALQPNCVPINFFGPTGSISQAGADFIRLNISDLTVYERYVASANVTGPLVELPAGDLAVALGTEYRKDNLAYIPDAAKAAGDIYGFNAERPVSGNFDVKEIYGEIVVPLLSDQPFADYLGLEAGVRYSDYSSIGSVTSYKVGAEYAPVQEVRVRGMYQRASRAPSVFELYQQGDQSFPPGLDPCTTRVVSNGAARTLSPEVRAFCAQQLGVDPVTAGFVQANSQIEAFFFGNSNLKEEVSDTYTIGTVIQPSFVEDLSFTVDYYNIKVADYIGQIEGGTTGVIAACFATLDMNSSACRHPVIGDLIYRNSIGELKARVPLGNVSQLRTSGIDFGVEYAVPVGEMFGLDGDTFGDKLDFGLNVTWVDSYELDDIEYVGTAGSYNISATLPKWKANLRLGYTVGPVRISWNTQFIDKMDNQGNIPDFADGGYNTVKSFWYHDLSLRATVNDNLEVFGGVKNLTDKQPPVFDNSPDGNTDPNAYDVLGRQFFLGATVRF